MKFTKESAAVKMQWAFRKYLRLKQLQSQEPFSEKERQNIKKESLTLKKKKVEKGFVT